MMLGAPPRANTGALEPDMTVVSAARAREHFRDLFMSNILVWRDRAEKHTI
jgi:hypothetical protein